MIHFLTTNPLARLIAWLFAWGKDRVAALTSRGDNRSIAFKGFLGALLVGLAFLFQGTLEEYQHIGESLRQRGETFELEQLPSIFPVIWQGLAVFLAVVAFLLGLWIRKHTKPGRREALITIGLWIAAIAALLAWLPTDVLATKAAISGKALAGETPSIPAYLGKLLLVSLLILSVPAAAMIYFRLGLMDRYVVHSVLAPFSFCMFSFIAIWIIADFSDNGPVFAGLEFSRVVSFYVVQVPFVILFVMPIVMLLAGLSAVSKMSKSNELISMIGSGRSVLRILTPVIVIGVYSSLICLAFKYEWAPKSVGYKEAIMETAKQESWAKQTGNALTPDLWAKRGWMHINEVDARTWFVGKVPFRLSDEMADVVVWQMGEDGYPKKVWKALRARWIFDAEPPHWLLSGTSVLEYDDEHIPRITSAETLLIEDWSETPWLVLSSSQNPEFLGLPGLTTYLNANPDMEERSLAPFRTNWWYIFAEPLNCLALILVSAPLGVVYSRRGVMGGVAGAIIVFAMMYVMRGTFLALGHRGAMNPFLAAWATNFVVAAIGIVLFWFRARNREIPKFRTIISKLFRGGPRKEAAA